MSMTDSKYQASFTYSSYLKVNELLDLQKPVSDGPEHDEMLFIVIHQTYELWFKQLIHEFDQSMKLLQENKLFETLAVLGRIRTVYKILVAQIDILETMTPLQFNSFRGFLESSSGFQSAQFRQVEAILGRRDENMISHFDPKSDEIKKISKYMNKESLWDVVLNFLNNRGIEISKNVLNRDFSKPYEASKEVEDALLNTYRNDAEASLLLEKLVDIDEGQQEWRYRHVKMVERTIGSKIGTGGSSGAKYLAATLFKPALPELWSVRSQL
jgi:tryptophan 2,3-dioxygenase